jgi:hypothetical protein
MKKYLQLIIVFSLIAFYSTNTFSQSIQVKSGPMFGQVDDFLYTIDDKTGDKIPLEQSIANLTLINTTDKTINFKMNVKLVKLVMGHEISICWDVCLPPFRDDYTSPLTYKMDPNQVTTTGLFSVHLYPYMLISDNPVTYTDPTAGISIMKIIFENTDNPNDKYEYNLTFNVIDPNTSVEESNSSEPEIMEITPNPANEETKLTFSSPIDNEIQHLNIFDIFGNLVFAQDIIAGSGDVIIDTSKLSSGSYYCRLVSGAFRKSKVKTLLVK